MRSKLLNKADGQRTFALIMESGDELTGCLRQFATRERISAAQFTGLGALRAATLNYFDWESRKYQPTPIQEQVEVASLIGDVALSPDGVSALHAHVVHGRRDGTALAGHLSEAYVRPTVEIVLTESPAHLQKAHDAESGLALIKP
jgi:predicted DNA-binding protein with PD1-like motif